MPLAITATMPTADSGATAPTEIAGVLEVTGSVVAVLLMFVVGYLERTEASFYLIVGFGIVAGALSSMHWAGYRRRVARLRGFSAAMSETNRLILRRPDPQVLYETICKICVTAWNADSAAVDLLDNDEPKRQASWGAVRAFPLDLVCSRTESKEESLILTTATSGEPTVSNDAARDLRMKASWPWLRAQHVGSIASLPIKRGGKTIGALTLVSDRTGFFDHVLIRLLREMAEDMSFALDNSDRERSEGDALKVAEKGQHLFRAIFDKAPIPMLVFELRTKKIVRVNDLACTHLVMDRSELMGMQLSNVGTCSSVETKTFLEGVLDLDGITTDNITRMRAGKTQWSNVMLHAKVIDYLGTPSLLVVATDVSESEATAAESIGRVRAEEANRAKNKFLSQMSHELRTPLNAILGFAQLLSASSAADLSTRQTDWVKHISEAGWHLLGLVNDVLDLSRIESGKLEMLLAPTDLVPLIDEVVAVNQPHAREMGIDLRATYPSSHHQFVMADSRRLRQVLINLLSNAIKYGRVGGCVEVNLAAGDSTHCVNVVDDGIGMTKQQAEHLFEPFNRLGRQSGLVEGAGIGLALSRDLMERMGGSLKIASSTGEGTRASLTLPTCDDIACAPGPDGDRVRRRRNRIDEVSPLGRVLYIEDNPVNQILVEQMLRPWSDVTITHADTGEDGIRLAEELMPDIVLLDMVLPDMSGAEVLAALRKNPHTRDLRVVALSASAMEEDVAIARGLGVLDYWTKPLDLVLFLGHMRGLLQSGVLIPDTAQGALEQESALATCLGHA
ncbi:MAG: ATP-binding protein [Caldimonas sp.]